MTPISVSLARLWCACLKGSYTFRILLASNILYTTFLDHNATVIFDFRLTRQIECRLKEEYQVVLIDLDNVGIENKDRYLGFQSREYPWPANHAAGKLMRRADDKAFLISTWDTSRKPRQPKAQMRCCQAFARGPQKCLLSRGLPSQLFAWAEKTIFNIALILADLFGIFVLDPQPQCICVVPCTSTFGA